MVKKKLGKPHLDALHDGFGEGLLPVLLPRSVRDVVVELVDGVAPKIAVRFVCRFNHFRDEQRKTKAKKKERKDPSRVISISF